MLEIERGWHFQYIQLEVIRCYPVSKQQGGTMAWMLEGPAEGPGRWTEEEIAQVSLLLSQYRAPRDQFGPTFWYLFKRPAFASENDQRPTYTIDKAVASRLDYIRATHCRDLEQLLRSWVATQQDGEDAQARDMGACIDDLFAASPQRLQQMLVALQERGADGEG